MTTTELLVIHDLGAAGGAPWLEAFGGWSGPVLAPDLPGHGEAPPPAGGHQQVGDAVYPLLAMLAGRAEAERVVVGVGRNGAVARLFALAGRAVGLVLVDGLGGPWLDVAGRDRAIRESQRQILATPGAIGPPPADGPDPRALLAPGPMDREFVIGQAEAITVPTLAVESPASPTPDAAEIVAHFADGRLVRVPEAAPATVADVVRSWWLRS